MTRITSAAAFSFLALASAAAPQAAFADNLDGKAWAVNIEQSKLGAGVNTLVLERNRSAMAATSPADAGGSIVVISHGNIYLGTADAGSGSGMALEQIGANIRVIGDCGTWCRRMRPNNRLVLSFTAVGTGARDMGRTVVFNTK